MIRYELIQVNLVVLLALQPGSYGLIRVVCIVGILKNVLIYILHTMDSTRINPLQTPHDTNSIVFFVV
jgi:hypothetical protein